MVFMFLFLTLAVPCEPKSRHKFGSLHLLSVFSETENKGKCKEAAGGLGWLGQRQFVSSLNHSWETKEKATVTDDVSVWDCHPCCVWEMNESKTNCCLSL